MVLTWPSAGAALKGPNHDARLFQVNVFSEVPAAGPDYTPTRTPCKRLRNLLEALRQLPLTLAKRQLLHLVNGERLVEGAQGIAARGHR